MIVCKADYCGIVCLPSNTVTVAVKAHKVYRLRLSLKYIVNIYITQEPVMQADSTWAADMNRNAFIEFKYE